MKSVQILLFAATFAQAQRVVDIKAADGIVLKGTYFAASKPGPGILLFHQSNRTRKSWEGVAGKLEQHFSPNPGVGD